MLGKEEVSSLIWTDQSIQKPHQRKKLTERGGSTTLPPLGETLDIAHIHVHVHVHVKFSTASTDLLLRSGYTTDVHVAIHTCALTHMRECTECRRTHTCTLHDCIISRYHDNRGDL